MENGKEIEVCKSVVKVCMDRVRRIDPQYSLDSFFELVEKYPAIAQSLYDAEMFEMHGESRSAPCGVDSQRISDTPQKSKRPPVRLLSEVAYLTFVSHWTDADGGKYYEICNEVLDCVCRSHYVHSQHTVIDDEDMGRFYFVVVCTDCVVRVRMRVMPDNEIIIGTVDSLPSEALASHIESVLVNEFGFKE